jgi:predicted Zn-dependent protease
MADERDPAVHWAMGRVLMLRGQPDESISALTRSIDLSPNFALGHYYLSFVHSIVGTPARPSLRPTTRATSARSTRC